MKGWIAAVSATSLLLIGLAGCVGAAGAITDHLDLSATRVASGQRINGTLVIENPGPTINLTKVATVSSRRRRGKPTVRLAGCMPAVAVALENRHYQPGVAFPASCAIGPLFIRHGTTRIRLSVLTTYMSCTQSVEDATATPRCSSPAGFPGFVFPPLPKGRYQAQVVWDETVPLPKPKAVTVTLTGSRG